MKNINDDILSRYELVQPESIEIINDDIKKFVDIEVEDDNTFHIFLEKSNQYLLTHNCDGDSITALLLNFFSKWRGLFDLGKIYRCLTPLLVIKKAKVTKYFYTQTEWEEYQEKNSLSGWNIEYKKGLGALEDEEYEDMIQNPRKVKLSWDDLSEEMLECWFGDDSSLRKKQLTK